MKDDELEIEVVVLASVLALICVDFRKVRKFFAEIVLRSKLLSWRRDC
jgi:hypothetical protein